MTTGARRASRLAALVATLGILLPTVARAESLLHADACPLIVMPEDDTPEARKEHMRRGIEASRRGDWNIAYGEFRSAWCSQPNFAIAASLADVEMKLGRYDDAARHWVYFLKNAPVERTEERKDAHDQLAECRRHLGRVRIVVDDAAVEVFVDHKSVDWHKGDDLWVAPGQHTVLVRSGDWQSPGQSVAVVVGQVQTVTFTVPPPAPHHTAPAASSTASPPPGAATTSDPSKPESSGTRTAVLITGASLTAIAAVAGVVFTLQGDSAEDDWKVIFDQIEPGACRPSPDRPPLCDDLLEKAEAVDAARDRAIGSFVTAGVLGAATAAAYLLWPEHEAQQVTGARLRAAPLIAGSHRGVQLRLDF